tara:strand:+ start:301 stop:714 length:414 start_codon:yes stop_codon:yes gene_type:complete
MARRKRINGHRRRKSSISPLKSRDIENKNLVKGSAEKVGQPEGEESGKRELYSGKEMNKGSAIDRMRKMSKFNDKQKQEGVSSRADIEQMIDEKVGGGDNNQAKTLKTPKNDATTKELTTSSKDNAAQEAVTRLYKQ